MISQIDLIAAISIELERQGIESFVPRQFNALIAAANSIIEEFEKPPVMASPSMGIVQWLSSDDTGQSSMYMASVLDGGFSRPYAHPHDVDDFGRCVRLLEAVPELKERLQNMKESSQQWRKLVNHWGAIADRYRAKDWSKANEYIKECIKAKVIE